MADEVWELALRVTGLAQYQAAAKQALAANAAMLQQQGVTARQAVAVQTQANQQRITNNASTVHKITADERAIMATHLREMRIARQMQGHVITAEERGIIATHLREMRGAAAEEVRIRRAVAEAARANAHQITAEERGVIATHLREMRAAAAEEVRIRRAVDAERRRLAREENQANSERRMQAALGSRIGVGGGMGVRALASGLVTGDVQAMIGGVGGGAGIQGFLAAKAAEDVQALSNAIQALERRIVQMAEHAAMSLLRAAAAATAFGMAFTAVAVSAAVARDRTMRGLTATMGGAKAAQEEFKKLQEIALKPGVDLESALHFAQMMKAVGMETSRVNELLRETANLNAAMGGTPAQLSRIGYAFAEVAGKGKITGEQLRMLARDMPIMMDIIRKEFGTTSAEGINKLGLSANEFFDRFIARAKEIPRVASGAANAVVNLKQAWNNMLVDFGNAFTGKSGIEFIDELAAAIKKLSPYLAESAKRMSSYLDTLTSRLRSAMDPKAIEEMVRAVLKFGINAEYAFYRAAHAGAYLLAGVGLLAGFVIDNLPGMIRMVLGLGAAMMMLQLAQDPLRLGAVLGAMAGFKMAFGDFFQDVMDKTGKAATTGVEVARGAGEASKEILKWTGSLEDLDKWHQQALDSASKFTLGIQQQTAAVEENATALNSAAEAAQKLAEMEQGADKYVNDTRRAHDAAKKQAKEEIEAMLPAMYQAARGAEHPNKALKELEEDNPLIAKVKREIENLKARSKFYKDNEDKYPGAKDAADKAEHKLKAAEEHLRNLTEEYSRQAQSVTDVIDAEKKLQHEREEAAKKAEEERKRLAAEHKREVHETAMLFKGGLAEAGKRAWDDIQEVQQAMKYKGILSQELRDAMMNEPLQRLGKMGFTGGPGNMKAPGWYNMPEAAGGGQRQKERERIYIEMDRTRSQALRESSQERMTSQILGNWGGGLGNILAQGRSMSDNERMVQSVSIAAKDTATVLVDALRRFPAIIQQEVHKEMEVMVRNSH